MKKCDYFKDLILTDYIDGELDKNLGASVESHLLDCSDCRAFFKEVKNNTALPFQQALQQPVPAGLWEAVRQSIEHENQVSSPLADFIDKLKSLVVFPRMVPVFASLILIFLAGSVTLNTIHIQQVKDKDQGEYLVALLSPSGPSTTSDNNGLETPIEHYFL
jgi:anti-sigma factor RsiW